MTSRSLPALAMLLTLSPAAGHAQSPPRAASARPPAPRSSQPLCEAADRFLTSDRQLVTIVEPDTLDDWRTQKRTVGCRITAAGATARGVQPEAVFFYERIRAVGGWARTPDPRDAPTEASLRFRHERVDCLFNVYGPAMLMTEAEDRVDERKPLGPGETRYHVYVTCVPAEPAKP